MRIKGFFYFSKINIIPIFFFDNLPFWTNVQQIKHFIRNKNLKK
ncbi:hypothetical protein HMPREF0765_1654 [Sphingobacterium spiritivorum ATCC 33300]|uniref:Uncharacterized protein n=1 Tax=Sphingobacterium spiritivorum ATCC 33300 TaxID=525372 RepID=C2FWE8_SPHSI|nr:hypothetical protein HMPREF0765_1654 [Sphingobacterium spiritivorum ATCC 33300]